MGRENQKARSEQVRLKILDTALAIAVKEGFDAVSVRKISERMNYSTGIIYYHFKDKQDIINSIRKDESARFGQLIKDAADPGASFERNIKSIYYRIMCLALSEPEKYQLIVSARQEPGGSDPYEFLKVLTGHIERAVAAGELTTADPGRLAFAVWSSFLGFNLSLIQRMDVDQAEADKLFEIQADMILKGVLR